MWSTSLERPLTMINTDYFRNEWRVHTVALVCLTSYLAELLALRQLIFFSLSAKWKQEKRNHCKKNINISSNDNCFGYAFNKNQSEENKIVFF